MYQSAGSGFMSLAIRFSPFRVDFLPCYLCSLIEFFFTFIVSRLCEQNENPSLLAFCDRLDSIHNGAYHKSLSCVALIREIVSVVPHARVIYVSLIIKETNIKSEIVKYSFL